MNRLADGSSIRVADPDASHCIWKLEYRGLNDEERNLLTAFFDAAGGRLRSFLFLDPAGNLLTHSEDLTMRNWSVDGSLRIGAAEGIITVTNTAQVPQTFRQTIAAPSWYRYCGSALLRATAAGAVELFLESAAGRIPSAYSVGTQWSEASCSGSIDGTSEEIAFGLVLPAGMSLEIRGLQLEAQPGRSGYRRTTLDPAIFPETRFDQDELAFVANGLNDHSTTIRLISRTGA